MIRKHFKYFIILISVILYVIPEKIKSQNKIDEFVISSLKEDGDENKSIYNHESKKHGSLYYRLWGRHYKSLYHKPVAVKKISSRFISNKFTVVDSIPKLNLYILNNQQQQTFILRPLGGTSGFLSSDFLRDVYKKDDFKGTYLGDFVEDAYTIVHPYIFLVADNLAYASSLGATNSQVFYPSQDSLTEKSITGDRLMSLSLVTDLKNEGTLHDVKTLLGKLQENGETKIDEETYIRMRLFDMLIGDWNKILENYYWLATTEGNSTVYSPRVFDRSHSFTKVDGVLFKELLGMLGLGFITNYDARLKSVKKFNTLSYPLDVALTQNCDASMWVKQAQRLKQDLTDDVINEAFLKLPQEMQNEEARKIKEKLIARRGDLEQTAFKYYTIIQKTPIVTGTNKDDRFVIDQYTNKDLRIRGYDRETETLIFDKTYDKKYTKEIWIYSLDGNDTFEADKKYKNISLSLIGGKGTNSYKIANGKNVFIYESEDEEIRMKYLEKNGCKIIIPDKESAMEYDYKRLSNTSFSFTPIGIYDSDLGLSLGTSAAYTVYGFRRAPYTRRHQISYDYKNGFTYQGIFPSYDEKKSLHVAAYIGSPSYFTNFFGFGNNTNGYKDEKRNFNRVNISKYMLAPALYYNIAKDQTLNVCASFETYKVKNPKDRDRFINQLYNDDHAAFDRKYFTDISVTYQIEKKYKHTLSSVSFLVSPGWTVNLLDPIRNFAYIKGDLGINLKLTDRITFATLLRGRALSSNKYEFYQAATTELRGFRNNRFIGRQSFYQYSDIRFDMGRIENPFTPLSYGVFAGIDNGRVWYPHEYSKLWHSSYGGGIWLTLLRKFTGKFSCFGSSDAVRFKFELGMGF